MEKLTVRTSERLPEIQESDTDGDVLAFDRVEKRWSETCWQDVAGDPSRFTHWMFPPESPLTPKDDADERECEAYSKHLLGTEDQKAHALHAFRAYLRSKREGGK